METPSITKRNEVEQLDNTNLLYDLRKIKCELIFFNKDKNILFFNQIKNLLSEEINTINSFNYQDDHKSFYLKYMERDTKDIDDQKDFILNSNTCVYLFMTILTPTLRQEQIINFETQYEQLNRGNAILSCILIFFYENEEELLKSTELNIKYPSNIFYVKTNLTKLDLKKLETENQLTIIIKQTILNGYVVSVQQKERPKDKIKFTKATLDYVKIIVGEYIQINENETALSYIEKCIYEYSYDEKGRWEEVKALLMFYSYAKKAEIENKKVSYNENIINLMDDARVRYKKVCKYEYALYNLYRQCNYYMLFFPQKIQMFDQCLINAFSMLAILRPTDVEYKFVQFLRFSELYKRANIKKKSNMFFLLASMTCLE